MRSYIVKRIALAVALLAVLAGCQNMKRASGYDDVKALVKPNGRAIAILPFSTRDAKGASPRDGVQVAQMAVLSLREALAVEKETGSRRRAEQPPARVVGPDGIPVELVANLNESRWYEIGQALGVQLLLVGRIKFIEQHYDDLVQAHEGVAGIEFRVLDVSKFPPVEVIEGRNWDYPFPEERFAKFDVSYATMEAEEFRRQMLESLARHVAGVFVDHKERTKLQSRDEVIWKR
jgi:hypothetical protein